ncbi:MAG: hypothetical protein M0R03_00605 [Novosphingobium sp.]|nr:hypothetical protein [Novosphingobium sp.]
MLIDGFGTASLVNGVLRIELVTRNARGKDETTGVLEIPASRIALVSASFQTLVTELRDRIAEHQKGEEAQKDGQAQAAEN